MEIDSKSMNVMAICEVKLQARIKAVCQMSKRKTTIHNTKILFKTFIAVSSEKKVLKYHLISSFQAGTVMSHGKMGRARKLYVVRNTLPRING